MNDTILKMIKSNARTLENLQKKSSPYHYTGSYTISANEIHPDSEVKALIKDNIYQLAKLLKENK